MTEIKSILNNLPEGYIEVVYNHGKYGLTKTSFNGGKSIKVYAKALNGPDFISLNYYETTTADYLKPCEMPEKKVMHFLKNLVHIERNKS